MTDIRRLDDDLRRILTHLADELLPLTPWLNDAKPYAPPGAFPWREGPGPWSLTMSDLGFLPFFEGLLAETSGDIDLVARFERVSRDPLASCPILDVESWRAGRGLAKVAQFDIGDSRNMPVDDKNRLCSRAPLYAEFWPLLRATVGQAEVDARAAGAPLDWSRLTAELLTDRCKSWPYWQPRASSTFMRQLRKDVLYAALGARNPAPLPGATRCSSSSASIAGRVTLTREPTRRRRSRSSGEPGAHPGGARSRRGAAAAHPGAAAGRRALGQRQIRLRGRAMKEVDFVVIGSSGGGGTISWLLAKAGFEVVVLEQGADSFKPIHDDVLPAPVNPALRRFNPDPHDEYRYRVEQPVVQTEGREETTTPFARRTPSKPSPSTGMDSVDAGRRLDDLGRLGPPGAPHRLSPQDPFRGHEPARSTRRLGLRRPGLARRLRRDGPVLQRGRDAAGDQRRSAVHQRGYRVFPWYERFSGAPYWERSSGEWKPTLPSPGRRCR